MVKNSLTYHFYVKIICYKWVSRTYVDVETGHVTVSVSRKEIKSDITLMSLTEVSSNLPHIAIPAQFTSINMGPTSSSTSWRAFSMSS